MSDLGAIFHVKKAGVQYDAHAYTTHEECPNPTLKIKFKGQQAYVKLVSKGTGDVPCYVKTKGGAVFQVIASPVKPQENFFVAKGETPWYNSSWRDRTHVTNIDTSISGQAIVTCDANVTTMNDMFLQCSSLTELDLSHLDISKVTNMNTAFSWCSKLKKLNLSNVDTSNVTSMENMFWSCSKLTELDLSSFDTSKVTNMKGMFYYCPSLISINLSSFNTANVTTMKSMFWICSKLTELDLSHFNTSKVTDMKDMFHECYSLTELDISNFDTSKVTDMSGMFDECNSLTNIKGIIDMQSCQHYGYMFNNCSKLTGVKIKNPPINFSGAGLNSSQYTIVS